MVNEQPDLSDDAARSPELFGLADEQERELLRLLGGDTPSDDHRRLVWRLGLFVQRHREIRAEKPDDISRGQLRKKLTKLERDLKSAVSRLSVDSLSWEGHQRLASVIGLKLEPWLKDVLHDHRWYGKLPAPERYLCAFELILRGVSELVGESARPSLGEARGGRRRNTSRFELVETIVFWYKAYLGRLPPTTKEGPFEAAVVLCLAAAGYRTGKVNDVLCRAVKAVRAYKKTTKTPAKPK